MSLLCWSGGLDSTLALHRIATEHRDGSTHHPHGIRAITIVHPQVSMHEKAAAKARAALKEKFRTSGFTINYLEVSAKQDFSTWRPEKGIGSSDNPQALLWLTTAINYLERDEDLYSGYIRTDDFWHNAGRYQAAFDALQVAAGHTGRMLHPLEWDSKADVIRQTKEQALHDLCWWCEDWSPKSVRGRFEACGKCKSCETYAVGEWVCSRTRDATPVVKARRAKYSR